MQEKRDIFDRMMALPLLNIFEPFYKKNKEVLLYLFFGGLTFIVSIVTYAVFNVSMGINELIANVMSWVLAVLFAFATNRVWVFQAPTHTITEYTCSIPHSYPTIISSRQPPVIFFLKKQKTY